MLMPMSPMQSWPTPRPRPASSSSRGVITVSQFGRIAKCTEFSDCPGPPIVSVEQVGPPIRPLGVFLHRLVEVVDVDPVGHESRPPVMGRDLHTVATLVGAHRLAASLRATAAGRLEPRSRSSTSAQLRPGRPETEPPGCVHAPFWYRPSMGVR